jgi:hypothetical protein
MPFKVGKGKINHHSIIMTLLFLSQYFWVLLVFVVCSTRALHMLILPLSCNPSPVFWSINRHVGVAQVVGHCPERMRLAQVVGHCPERMRPWVQTLVLPQKKKRRKKNACRFLYFCAHSIYSYIWLNFSCILLPKLCLFFMLYIIITLEFLCTHIVVIWIVSYRRTTCPSCGAIEMWDYLY